MDFNKINKLYLKSLPGILISFIFYFVLGIAITGVSAMMVKMISVIALMLPIFHGFIVVMMIDHLYASVCDTIKEGKPKWLNFKPKAFFKIMFMLILQGVSFIIFKLILEQFDFLIVKIIVLVINIFISYCWSMVFVCYEMRESFKEGIITSFSIIKKNSLIFIISGIIITLIALIPIVGAVIFFYIYVYFVFIITELYVYTKSDQDSELGFEEYEEDNYYF